MPSIYFDLYGVKDISYICRGILLDRIYCITPFLYFLDHLSKIAWYLWLAKGATKGRKKLHIILAHLPSMGLILLRAAILGPISRIWITALEVFFPCFGPTWQKSRQDLDPAYHSHYVSNLPSVHCVMCNEGFHVHFQAQVRCVQIVCIYTAGGGDLGCGPRVC